MVCDDHPTDETDTEPDRAAPRYEWGVAERPSTAVIEAAAAAIDSDPVDLPLLSERIDPDALDALVAAKRNGAGPVRVTFTYCGHEVRLASDGGVELRPVDE